MMVPKAKRMRAYIRRSTLVIAVAACLAVGPASRAGTNFLDDPQDAAVKLALKYATSGENADEIAQQLEDQLRAEGTQVGLDAVALGMDSIMPGSGASASAIPNLINLFGNFAGATNTANPLQVLQNEISALDARLSYVEKGLNRLSGNVIKLRDDVVKLANQARTNYFVDQAGNLGVRTQLQDIATEIRFNPPSSKEDKLKLLNTILRIADGFLPTLDKVNATNVWSWSTIVYSAGTPQAPGLQTDTKERFSMDLALEPYLQALAVFVAAEYALDVSIENDPYGMRARLNQHIVFLTGTAIEAKSSNLLFTLLEGRWPINCSSSLAGHVDHLSCSSSGITRSADIDISNQPDWSLGADDFQLAELRRQVRDALISPEPQDPAVRDSLLKLLAAAANAIKEQHASSTPPGDLTSVIECTDSNTIYAVDSAGKLHEFIDQTCKIDTYAQASGSGRISHTSDTVGARVGDTRIGQIERGGGSSSGPEHGPHSGQSGSASASSDVMARAVGATQRLPPAITGPIHDDPATQRTIERLSRYKYEHQLAEYPVDEPGFQDYSTVVPGMAYPEGYVIYGLDADGGVHWGKIRSSTSFARPPDQLVANGWSQKRNIFSTGEATIYSVEPNGDLSWDHHINNQDGSQAPQWDHRTVGNGWGSFTRLFSVGQGVIYAVDPDGTLFWYKHIGYQSGVKSWAGPIQVGNGWNGFKFVIGALHGCIYAVNQNGELLFYKHIDWGTGGKTWDGPVKIADGWNRYSYIFANLGAARGKPLPIQGPN